MDYRTLFRNIRARPGVYFLGSEFGYDQLTALVGGVDIGSQHSLLAGFREFLILELDGGNNLAWPELALRLSVPDTGRPLDPDADRTAVDGLFDLLDEFLAEVTDSRARTRIYHEYFQWLQRQRWYDGDLERFHALPAPPRVSLDEAATRLGLSRQAIFDLIAAGRLRPVRIGAELHILERHLSEVMAEQAAQHEAAKNSEPPTSTLPW